MKRSEALQIVALLNAAFPRDALEGPSFELYADEIALLHDAQMGAAAARTVARSGDRFPSLKEFRAAYRGAAEAARAATPALPAASWTAIPEWVHVWWWARNLREPREPRSLPQQRDGLAAEPFLTAAEYDGLQAEWVAAGSPRLRPDTLAA